MFKVSIIDSIIVAFPFLIYAFLMAVNYNANDRKKGYFHKIAIMLSVILLLKFGYDLSLILAIINIPLFIALKNKYYVLVGTFMSIPILNNLNNYNAIIIISITYFLIIVLNIIIKNDKKMLFSFIALESISLFLTYYEIKTVILFISLLFIIEMLYRKMMIIIDFSYKYKELEKELAIKKSLFKITHEIKNPIAVCKAYLDMFDLNNLKKSEKYVAVLKNEIERLLCLLEDFSLVNKMVVNLDIMDINMLLEDNIESLKQMLKNNNININFFTEDDEVYIMGDYNRMSQVIINLIKNGMEANPSNIIVELKTLNNKVIVNVKDDGTGMDPSIINKIKEPFYTTKLKGNGLGVSLSNEIIEAHKGKLSYFTEYGKGTTAQIILPVYVI